MKIGYLTIMIFTNLLAVGIFNADYENAQTDALIILFTGMASIYVIWKKDHPIIEKIVNDFFKSITIKHNFYKILI